MDFPGAHRGAPCTGPIHAHVVYACDFDPRKGTLSHRRVLARFVPRDMAQGSPHYGGRPDGAAVDAEGCYWVVMFEGGCLQRFTHQRELLQMLPLSVRCPTMLCFGGPDPRTLFITPSRENRPAPELADRPLPSRVLQLRVDVPGLATNFMNSP